MLTRETLWTLADERSHRVHRMHYYAVRLERLKIGIKYKNNENLFDIDIFECLSTFLEVWTRLVQALVVLYQTNDIAKKFGQIPQLVKECIFDFPRAKFFGWNSIRWVITPLSIGIVKTFPFRNYGTSTSSDVQISVLVHLRSYVIGSMQSVLDEQFYQA